MMYPFHTSTHELACCIYLSPSPIACWVTVASILLLSVALSG